MIRALTILSLLYAASATAQATAEGIPLRLQPDPAAPVITRMIATENVLLDAAPATGDWRQLKMEIPFEGYVPTASLTKSLAIAPDTPVHFLPSANSEVLTRVEEGDIYEVLRAEDGWSTVGFKKRLTTYFQESPMAAAPEPIPEPPVLNIGFSEPAPIPAAPTIAPEAAVAGLPIDGRPPANVIWKSTLRTPNAQIREPQPQAVERVEEAPLLPDGIMVGPAQTQAREAMPAAPDSDKPLRLLTGILVRQITSEGPAYPIRLESPEGRLIAYVDFSGIFIKDLKPFLGQRVFLRGQIFPVKANDSQLVIFAEKIHLAN
ncbi:MAG: hypothetical protein ACPG3X_04705 [Opitutales bacterium]